MRQSRFYLVVAAMAILLTSTALSQNAEEKAPQKKRGHVRIATLGPQAPSVDANAEPQKIVERVIAHWKGRFAQVLPDKPDLIVVPEALSLLHH